MNYIVDALDSLREHVADDRRTSEGWREGYLAAIDNVRDALASEPGPAFDVERFARARHRWQHSTFALDLSPVLPGASRRCGCLGWAETIGEMLDLLDATAVPA